MKKIPSNLIQAILAILMIVTGGVITRSNPVVSIPTASATPAITDQPGILASTPVPVYTATPYAGNMIRLAWFYKPPEEKQLDLIAQNFDFFILTHKDENELAALRAGGLKAPVSEYLLLLVINDPEDCIDVPAGNQVAYKAGDFCQISEQHPDWFLLDNSGKRMQSGKDSFYMDPGNQEFRAFWLERARELQETYGWDSVFLDNVEASLTQVAKNGQPAKYPDDASFQQAVEGFLQYIRSNYFQPRGKPMYGNVVSVAEETVWESYLQYLDGAMIETFATDWSDGYRSHDDWEEQMQRVETGLANGKTMILVSQGRQDDTELQNFAFASYLLIANGNAFFRYTNSDSYREIWMYENYHIDLGMPLGPRYQSKNEWRRDFANGYVIVDPKKHKAQIVLTP